LSNKKNIVLCGEMGSGKTLAANYIARKYGHTTVNLSSPIYEIARNYFGMKDKDRQILQSLSKLRDIDPLIYVKALVRNIKNNKIKSWVVDDVRFNNELLYFATREDTVLIKLDVPYNLRLTRLQGEYGEVDEFSLFHESEIDIPFMDNKWFDYVFEESELAPISNKQKLYSFINNIKEFKGEV